MTITELEAFICGIPLDERERETLLNALSEAVGLEDVDPLTLDRIAVIAETIGTELARQREETAQELEKAKKNLGIMIENAKQKIADFDTKAITHIRKLAQETIAEIDRIEQIAARDAENRQRVDEASQIRTLMKAIHHKPKP